MHCNCRFFVWIFRASRPIPPVLWVRLIGSRKEKPSTFERLATASYAQIQSQDKYALRLPPWYLYRVPQMEQTALTSVLLSFKCASSRSPSATEKGLVFVASKFSMVHYFGLHSLSTTNLHRRLENKWTNERQCGETLNGCLLRVMACSKIRSDEVQEFEDSRGTVCLWRQEIRERRNMPSTSFRMLVCERG